MTQPSAALSAGPVPQSEAFGFYYDLKRQLNQAVAYVRAPIEELRAFVKEKKPLPPRPAPGAAPAAGMPKAAPAGKSAVAASAPPAGARGKSAWGVATINVDSVPDPFFTTPPGQFKMQLNVLKTKLGKDYAAFAEFVTAVLQGTPDAEKLMRFAPRREWAVPFLLRRTLHNASREYLLILGAEVTAKVKGMRVSAKEEHDFQPYFIFAAQKDPEGDFGAPMRERQANGLAFQEYSFTSAGVLQTVRAMVDALRGVWTSPLGKT